MITEVIMKRELFNREISQKSKSGLFSATDLVKAGNYWRVSNGKEIFSITTWLAKKSTKEFIEELENVYDNVIIRAKAKNQHTWVHPYLFIDLALAISPKLKIEVYQWIYDELLKYRNSSGDSYKKMTGALYLNMSNKSKFKDTIQDCAMQIRESCGVDDWNNATEEQLKLRDKIHDNISLLCDVLKNNEDAIRIGIKKALEE